MSLAVEKLIEPTSINQDATEICDFDQLNLGGRNYLSVEPFPHVVHHQFIAPQYYSELVRTFPTCPPSTGPTGHSLYWGDEGYERLLTEHPAWRALFNAFQSQKFVDWGRAQFADSWEAGDCRINLADARYVSYREDRIDKERATLRKVEHEPHELWVRMDIHQGQTGYDRRIHVDHARRLISMLIYMCDHAENELAGGELFLHSSAAAKSGEPGKRITPRHNLMVAFPCSARSYHSVSKITSLSIPRNYIQVHISSSVDVWPREKVRGSWRQRLGSLKRRFT
jgi:2OG-Fe(II) oxygenase superfamily